ncbi:hypothetical protein [Streptomyces sp. NPDC001675]
MQIPPVHRPCCALQRPLGGRVDSDDPPGRADHGKGRARLRQVSELIVDRVHGEQLPDEIRAALDKALGQRTVS